MECPPYGADTAFCTLYLAYETLSDGMKDMLEGVEAVNEAGNPQKQSNKYQSMEELAKNEAMAATYPVVRCNPASRLKFSPMERHTEVEEGA